MYRGLGSDQHERKNALKTSGYWIVAVIRDNTLSSPKVIKKYTGYSFSKYIHAQTNSSKAVLNRKWQLFSWKWPSSNYFLTSSQSSQSELSEPTKILENSPLVTLQYQLVLSISYQNPVDIIRSRVHHDYLKGFSFRSS